MDAKNVAPVSNQGYIEKLDKVLTAGVTNWFQGLSKQELLDFLRDRPDITADAIRDMLAKSNVCLGFATQFDTVSHAATSAFEDDK